MTDLASRVIRSSEVRIAGRRQIGGGAEETAPAVAGRHASARIVAEDAAGATIEVVCECGKRLYVRCAYRGAQTQPARQQPGSAMLQETAQ